MSDPIEINRAYATIPLKLNFNWMDPRERKNCKYSPVMVDDRFVNTYIKNSIKIMLTNRINICRRLALRPDKLGGHTSLVSIEMLAAQYIL